MLVSTPFVKRNSNHLLVVNCSAFSTEQNDPVRKTSESRSGPVDPVDPVDRGAFDHRLCDIKNDESSNTKCKYPIVKIVPFLYILYNKIHRWIIE